MSRKIFQAIWTVTFTVLLVSLILIMWVTYSHFTTEQVEQLRNETELVTRGVTLNGLAYFDSLDTIDFRITWITPDGTIIYDNEADAAGMENHLEREEIREALDTGYGESERYSATLSDKQLYTAERLSDGSVLRLSITQATVWNLFLKFSIPIILVIAAALIASFYLASRLSVRIAGRYNALDLDHPMTKADDPAFAEIRPLLKGLEDQHEQIRRDREAIERTALIRQEFTANASHELKTPLHAISGYAELLESGMVRDEDIAQFAGKIRTESQRMSKLVEDIIDLTRLDAGAEDMEREECDLYRIASHACESLKPEAESRGIAVRLEGESAVLCGVPQILYSIVYNLLGNAIKYSGQGSKAGVSVRDLGEVVELKVTDHGIGIPKDEQDRIFERFYRVDKSRSKAVGGTGLGLSIVKHGARIHGAAIEVDSKEGKGSVFTLTFPKNNTSETISAVAD